MSRNSREEKNSVDHGPDQVFDCSCFIEQEFLLRLSFTRSNVAGEGESPAKLRSCSLFVFCTFMILTVESRERMAFSVERPSVSRAYHASGARLFSFFNR